MRQFRVWCPEFAEQELDGALYDNLYLEEAVTQYMSDHTDSEDEAEASQGRSWEVHVRRQGHNSKGEPFPALKYEVSGDYSFSWDCEVSDDCPEEDIETVKAA